MKTLPIIQMTNEEKEEYRKAEAAYLSDRFANPRDKSRADEGRGDNPQMTLQESVNMFMHTPPSSLNLMSEMYKFAEFFGIDNKIKVS